MDKRSRLGSRTLPSRQRGAALMMVLLLVAMMLLLSVGLVDGVRYNSQRLLNQRFMDQSFWYALGGEYIATYALEDIADEGVTSLGQDWARDDIVFPIEGGSIAGKIDDEQACFNVNNLYPPEGDGVDPTTETAAMVLFRNLLKNLDIPEQRAEFIMGRLQDWIDEDFSPEGIYGAEDLSYNTGDYPFMPPNGLIDSTSELSLFAEYEEDEESKILPYLCALPEVDTTININTLEPDDAPLLAAAIENRLSVEEVKQLMSSRADTGWEDVASFVAELNLPADNPLAANTLTQLGVQSRYFKGVADVFYEQRQVRIFSRFVLKSGKAIVYSREYGEIF
jgi:general secretion pathway protein K